MKRGSDHGGEDQDEDDQKPEAIDDPALAHGSILTQDGPILA